MKLKLNWKVKKLEDTSRAGLKYCFKSCSANKN